MEKKHPMCISSEEHSSMRALAGTLEETVELSKSLYNAVVPISISEALVVSMNDDKPHSPFPEEPITRQALKVQALPSFEKNDTEDDTDEDDTDEDDTEH